MCETCGCSNPSDHSNSKIIDVHTSLFSANDALAKINREHFDKTGTVALNLISGPGSGKTTLLEHTIEALKGEINIGVIEGDIENVGNLVCPSSFDLGEHERVVLVSVPEGPDKPAKYPKAFISSHTFLVTKTDLLTYFDFPVPEAIGDALHLNPHLRTMALSSTTGDGMTTWLNYLRELVAKMKEK